MTRLGSVVSILDFTNMGKLDNGYDTVSLRNFVRLGSSLSYFGVGRFGSACSVLDFIGLSSAVSVRTYSRFGSTASVYGVYRMGSFLSVLDSVTTGSSISIRTWARMGSSLSLCGYIKLGFAQSVLDFFQCASNSPSGVSAD